MWISSADSNTTNPDTGGAGWISLAFEGSQAITVTTADVTITQLQSAYPVLIVSGAITAARNLIFPAIVGEWIVQNNTTGAFTLTAKTASGTGVTLTQGQSTYIYGDGTNIVFADSAKVASFNGRVGTVTLNATDVTTALGYVPVQPNGTGATGSWAISVTGNSATSGQVYQTSDPAASTYRLLLGNGANANGLVYNDTGSIIQGANISGNAATATIAYNSVTQANGTNDTTISTCAYTYAMGISWGQTWQNVTSSRAFNTVYTNSTGKPIFANVSIYAANLSLEFNMIINGTVAISDGGQNGQAAIRQNQSYIIPAGATYKLSFGGGYTTFNWAELR